ncbi:hypothetical protein [Campylobacter rectus]|uniref:hypothetical protein n=1 Tax=Campylobacter rectus TaxID=203 RepID=UPI0023F3F8CF|nr:hypothetical protein [Campylobacter rectus]
MRGVIYLIADSASDKSYFNRTYLSVGEESNVICRLERESDCVLGSEIKRMFEGELQKAR